MNLNQLVARCCILGASKQSTRRGGSAW